MYEVAAGAIDSHGFHVLTLQRFNDSTDPQSFGFQPSPGTYSRLPEWVLQSDATNSPASRRISTQIFNLEEV